MLPNLPKTSAIDLTSAPLAVLSIAPKISRDLDIFISAFRFSKSAISFLVFLPIPSSSLLISFILSAKDLPLSSIAFLALRSSPAETPYINCAFLFISAFAESLRLSNCSTLSSPILFSICPKP